MSGRSRTMSRKRVWYSGELNDFVDSMKTVAVGHLDNSGGIGRIRTVGLRYYELSDHLGNVVATVLDRKTGVLASGSATLYDRWVADVASLTDYYPFGMQMPGRVYEAGIGLGSKFGFNGQQRSDEVYGKGNLNTALFWEYDTRLGRRWNLDPKPLIQLSPYSVFRNSPILFNDHNGDVAGIDNIVGGAVGFIVEVGSQMLTNYVRGNPVGELNWINVGLATIEGAATSGLSAGKTFAIHGGVTLVKNAVEYGERYGISSSQDVFNILNNTAIDLIVDQIVDKVSANLLSTVGQKTLAALAQQALPSKRTIIRALEQTGMNRRQATAAAKILYDGFKELGAKIRELNTTTGSATIKAELDKKIEETKAKPIDSGTTDTELQRGTGKEIEPITITIESK